MRARLLLRLALGAALASFASPTFAGPQVTIYLGGYGQPAQQPSPGVVAAPVGNGGGAPSSSFQGAPWRR